MKIRPAWAPSSIKLNTIVITDPMRVQDRGIRGDLFIAKISNMESRFKHFGTTALNLNVENSQIQCSLVPSKRDEIIRNVENAISHGKAYIIITSL